MKHELNMIEYLDSIEELDHKIYKKKQFLKSKPMLGDYVPTNENGEVIEKPSKIASFGQFEYQQALDRVLWKGWKFREDNIFDTLLISHYSKQIINLEQFKTYEHLIISGIKLERISVQK